METLCSDGEMVIKWNIGEQREKNKDAQARDLPDVDSSWWQSSKDVSDPFAKVSNSFLYR